MNCYRKLCSCMSVCVVLIRRLEDMRWEIDGCVFHAFGVSTHKKICFVHNLISRGKYSLSIHRLCKPNSYGKQSISTYDVNANNKFRSEIWFKRSNFLLPDDIYMEVSGMIPQTKKKKMKRCSIWFCEMVILNWPTPTQL